MAVQIELSKGQVAIIDEDDYEKVSKYSWHANLTSSGHYRAASNRKKCPYNYMHQLIMDNKNVDHKDGNALNNTKENLRICTHNQNSKNQRKPRNNTSGYKGVVFDSRKENVSKRWVAQIKIEGKKKTLGRFTNPEEAAKAYDVAAISYFGEFACLNFKD